MSRKSITKLRHAIAGVQRQPNPKRRRYPAEVRRATVSLALAERARGVSVRSIAESLGLSYKTLCFWLQDRPRGFRSVTVRRMSSAESESPLRFFTAQGHRVEGLNREDLAYLLRSLS